MFDYTGRDEASLVDLADTYMTELLPEWTNRDDKDINWATIKTICKIMSIPNFYIDLAFNEQFPDTVQIRRNALRQAKRINMPVRVRSGGIVEVVAEIEPQGSTYTMLRGTKFTSPKGDFLLTDPVDISAGETSVTVSAKFGKEITGTLGVSNGTANQSFTLDIENIQQGEIRIYVNGTLWEETLDTLMMEDETAEVYKSWYNEDGTYTIDFGDDMYGAIPPNGATINYSLIVLEGNELGNIPSGIIDGSSDDIVTGIISSSQGTGGNNGDTLPEIKRKLKEWGSVQNRVVLPSDARFLVSNYPGVEYVKVKAVGSDYDVYLIPFGGGSASGTFLTGVENFLNKRKINTLTITANNFIDVDIVVSVDLLINNSYSRDLVKSRVKDVLFETINDIKIIENSVTVFKLYKALRVIEGLDDITISNLTTSGGTSGVSNIYLEDNQKAVIDMIDITISSESGGL